MAEKHWDGESGLLVSSFVLHKFLLQRTPQHGDAEPRHREGELLVKEKLVVRPAADDNVRRIFMITVTFIYCAAERNLISHPL